MSIITDICPTNLTHHVLLAFQCHSRSSEPTWIDHLPMTSYSRSIPTMGLCSTVSEIWRFQSKIANFSNSLYI